MLPGVVGRLSRREKLAKHFMGLHRLLNCYSCVTSGIDAAYTLPSPKGEASGEASAVTLRLTVERVLALRSPWSGSSDLYLLHFPHAFVGGLYHGLVFLALSGSAVEASISYDSNVVSPKVDRCVFRECPQCGVCFTLFSLLILIIVS